MAARLTAYLVVVIVAGTLIAGLIVGAQRDDSEGPVDLVVQNATVYAADGRGTKAEAIAVRGSRILRVGTTREIARLQQRQTQVIDARGGAVLPGFNDGHLRFGRSAFAIGAVDLSEAHTISEVLARVSAWSTEHPDAAWIPGRGWSPGSFRPGTPWRQVLDSVVQDRPVLLYGVDGTSLLANSAALRSAGFSRMSPDPAGGVIVREPRSGEPSGLLRGTAAEQAAGQVPPLTREERAALLRGAIQAANAAGITSAHSIDDDPDTLETYEQLRRAGDLTVRVYSAIPLREPISDDDLPRLEQARQRYPDDPLVKAGALSLHIDGALSVRAAALLTPYNGDGAGLGHLHFAPDDLNRTVRIADAAGWQVIAHASGDRAVRMALDAFAHAARSNHMPERGRRHRIGGLTLVDTADVSRMGPLGVMAAMQPVPALFGAPGDDLLSRLGPARAARAYPYRALAADTRLVFGTGWPASPLDPVAGLHAAAARLPLARDGNDTSPRRLTLTDAVEAWTSAGAWASFDDQRKGTVAPGMLADLVVLTSDIFAAPPEALADTKVAFTIFDGRVVYQRPPPASSTE